MAEVHPEVAALIKEAHDQGIDDEFVRKVVAACENDEEAITDLKTITAKRVPRPKLAPLPPYVRVLDPHEEILFEEMLAGEHQPEAIVE